MALQPEALKKRKIPIAIVDAEGSAESKAFATRLEGMKELEAHPTADVEGAKTLGMTAIWRRPVIGEPLEMTEDEPEPGPAEPDYTVENIGDLKGLPLFAGAMTPR